MFEQLMFEKQHEPLNIADFCSNFTRSILNLYMREPEHDSSDHKYTHLFFTQSTRDTLMYMYAKILFQRCASITEHLPIVLIVKKT